MYLISEFLTPLPFTIQADENLEQARKIMEAHHVRHLPVFRGGQMVGVIAERDLYMCMGISDLDWRREPARLAMSANPLRVSIDADARAVAKRMLADRQDCALVENEQGSLVGIFTDTDALKAMCDLLKTFAPSESC